MGKGKKEGPEKPLAQELCSLRARARMKHEEKAGRSPLCNNCAAHDKHVCRENGHVICDRRKQTGWVPIPFAPSECGLHTPAEATAA